MRACVAQRQRQKMATPMVDAPDWCSSRGTRTRMFMDELALCLCKPGSHHRRSNLSLATSFQVAPIPAAPDVFTRITHGLDWTLICASGKILLQTQRHMGGFHA